MTLFPRPRLTAFTLVELLVVISIIVTLLALLSPALDRAIYQAEMAVCGARLRSVAGSALIYAPDFRRQYPYRPTVKNGDGSKPNNLYVNTGPAGAFNASIGGGAPDDRPVL